MRIDKLISSMGIATRREISQNAKRGLVLVDGVPVRDPSRHIDPQVNVVSYIGEELTYREFVYVMLNKPEGYVSATDDPRMPYVLELLPERYGKMGLFPVGRLDRDTTGLMILTNNGPLAHALLSPKHHVEKEYRFSCEKPLVADAEHRFMQGITIDGGELCKSARLIADDDRLGGVIVLTEGKYHQIKRMLEAIGNRITRLERISFGSIPLDPSLKRGEFRELTQKEIQILENQK